jgi:uncharacterized protein DUF6221
MTTPSSGAETVKQSSGIQATLHDRLRADLDRRLAVARAATPGPWAWEATGQKDNSWGLGTVVGDDGETLLSGDVTDVEGAEVVDAVCYQDNGRLADAAHIALHDPADAIRRYAGELEVLERHTELPDSWGSCATCLVEDARGSSMVAWPCPEIRSLASRLGVSVDG